LSRLGGEAVTPIPRAASRGRGPHSAGGKNRIQPAGGRPGTEEKSSCPGTTVAFIPGIIELIPSHFEELE